MNCLTILSTVLFYREEQHFAEEEQKEETEELITQEPGKDQNPDTHHCMHFWIDCDVPLKDWSWKESHKQMA